MVSTSAASRSWRASISARARRSPVRSRKRATADAAHGAAANLDQAAPDRRHNQYENARLFRAGAQIAISSRRDEFGVQPASRKRGRRGDRRGRRRRAGSAPATSGASSSAFHATRRWSSSLTSASARSAADCRSATRKPQARVVGLDAVARAHELDGGEDGEGDGAEQRRHENDLTDVDVGERGHRNCDAARCGCDDDVALTATTNLDVQNRRRVPAMPPHAEDPSSVSRYSWEILVRGRWQPRRHARHSRITAMYSVLDESA